MANLNSWQKVSRVLGGDWGDGASGAATISSDPNTRATFTGTATQTTGTAGSTAFANGDLVLLHQTRGTGAGQWEINRVASGGGTTSLTFQVAHNYTYGTGAQIIKIPRYITATVSAHSVTAWNGTTGGVEVILGKTSITVSGALNANGLGYIGTHTSAGGDQGIQGEGTGGAMGGASSAANGSGGGGGGRIQDGGSWGGAGGGGGGNATAGVTGEDGSGYLTVGGLGAGGSAVGSADLITMNLGGAGGSHGARQTGYGCAASGYGGGIVILISKLITVSAAITSNGTNGGTTYGPPGASGGGAGGSILFVCNTASIGTYLTSTAGSGGIGGQYNGYYGGNGGAGSVGRIAVHHSGTVTGTTSPTFTNVTDATLHDLRGGAFLMNFI